MLHVKFQDHRISGEEGLFRFLSYIWHGGHLGHVTKMFFLQNLCSLFPGRILIKFGFDWPSCLREKDV